MWRYFANRSLKYVTVIKKGGGIRPCETLATLFL